MLRNSGVCEIKAAGPYKFIGFGAMDVIKPYKSTWFGDIHGPEAYKFMGPGGVCFADTGSAFGPEIGFPGRISAGF